VFDIALKNLWARKTRSILCILAVIVSVFLNGSTATMNNWMYETMTSELASYMGKIYVQQGGSGYPPIDSSIGQEAAEAILARADLGLNAAESAPLIFVRTERAMMPFMPAQEMVIGVPAGKERALLGNVEAAEGVNRFDAGEQGNVAILGEEMAASSGASVGQDITINRQTVRVIGILKKSSMDSVNIAAVMPLEAVQQIFVKERTVSAVLLTPDDVNRTMEVATVLRRDYPALEVATQDDMLAEAEEVLQMPMFYMSMMSLTAFIVAVAVIMSTMVMAVMERTREIGTLRAIGASRRLVLGTVLAEILVLSLIGGVPGSLLAVPMAAAMETTLPAPAQLAQIVLFAIAAGVVGGLYPAWRASRVNPIEALQYE
jgi:putative ABC transport system permease protein